MIIYELTITSRVVAKIIFINWINGRFYVVHATTLKYILYIHSIIYTPTYPWSQVVLKYS